MVTAQTQTGESEAARIRAAYERRKHTVPKSRYAAFTEDSQLSILQLQYEMVRLLKRFHQDDLNGREIFDIGCGAGFWIRQFIQWGARPQNIFGIDLIPDRVQEAKRLCPAEVTLQCGDASHLNFQDAIFDIVLQTTVFTSILDSEMKKNVAAEMMRVLRPGGTIVWYDYFFSNPRNPDVRGVSRQEIQRLFPDFRIFLKRVTLAPPIARLVAPMSAGAYRALSASRLFCTHYLGVFQKPATTSPQG